MEKTIAFKGEVHSIKEWASIIGVTESCLRMRLSRNWPLEKLLNPSRPGSIESNQKVCRRCGREQNVEAFPTYIKAGKPFVFSYCSKCESERQAQYYRKLRLDVLNKYCPDGIKCSLCSEARIPVLDIDHIHGDGKTDRERFGNTSRFYWWLHREPIMSDRYRVLCRNCNWLAWIDRHPLENSETGPLQFLF